VQEFAFVGIAAAKNEPTFAVHLSVLVEGALVARAIGPFHYGRPDRVAVFAEGTGDRHARILINAAARRHVVLELTRIGGAGIQDELTAAENLTSFELAR